MGNNTNGGSTNNLTGGIFNGTNSNSLAAFATYNALWAGDISDVSLNAKTSQNWFMVQGQTRPMLMMEYSTTITNAHQLQLMEAVLNASYTLKNNIDLTASMNNAADVWGTNVSFNQGAGFNPIGSNTTPFSGTFEGNSHTINGLFINNTSAYNGLFSATASTATLKNVGLTAVNITSTGVDTGALVGLNYGIISNTYATGSVSYTGTGTANIGGLVGDNRGAISLSYSAANVTSTQPSVQNVGGLVGALQ